VRQALAVAGEHSPAGGVCWQQSVADRLLIGVTEGVCLALDAHVSRQVLSTATSVPFADRVTFSMGSTNRLEICNAQDAQCNCSSLHLPR
jgi:uncharacterized membrane protein YdcZ (DUF606 family)